MNKEFWICEHWKGIGNPPEFQGVFDSEERAIAACRTDDYYIHPEILNQEVSHETIQPNGYYPRLETREEGNERNAKL